MNIIPNTKTKIVIILFNGYTNINFKYIVYIIQSLLLSIDCSCTSFYFFIKPLKINFEIEYLI